MEIAPLITKEKRSSLTMMTVTFLTNLLLIEGNIIELDT